MQLLGVILLSVVGGIVLSALITSLVLLIYYGHEGYLKFLNSKYYPLTIKYLYRIKNKLVVYINIWNKRLKPYYYKIYHTFQRVYYNSTVSVNYNNILSKVKNFYSICLRLRIKVYLKEQI